MRAGRLELAVAGLVLLTPFADAQQAPEYGCRMATSCRPAGFSLLNKERGIGMVPGLGLGVRWGPGFEIYIPSAENLTLLAKPTPIPNGQVFHLGTSLLAPPSPMPTFSLGAPPALTPTPPPSEEPKN